MLATGVPWSYRVQQPELLWWLLRKVPRTNPWVRTAVPFIRTRLQPTLTTLVQAVPVAHPNWGALCLYLLHLACVGRPLLKPAALLPSTSWELRALEHQTSVLGQAHAECFHRTWWREGGVTVGITLAGSAEKQWTRPGHTQSGRLKRIWTRIP